MLTLTLFLTTKLLTSGQTAYAVTLMRMDRHNKRCDVTRLTEYQTNPQLAKRALNEAKAQYGLSKESN